MARSPPPKMRAYPVLSVLLFSVALGACGGNAVVEPGSQSSKRAKLAIDKCEPPPAPEGVTLEEVYACIVVEGDCPPPGDELVMTELEYVLNKVAPCEESTVVYDVQCGPDLNAPVDCCYVARTQNVIPACD